jgi:hypothetical protein
MVSPMFPVPHNAQSEGVTDVQWYAGLAMQAMLVKQGIPESQSARDEIALWAFRMGQAMAATERRLHASEPD